MFTTDMIFFSVPFYGYVWTRFVYVWTPFMYVNVSGNYIDVIVHVYYTIIELLSITPKRPVKHCSHFGSLHLMNEVRFCQIMSFYFSAGNIHFIFMLNLVPKRLMRFVARARQPILQICIKTLHWATRNVL